MLPRCERGAAAAGAARSGDRRAVLLATHLSALKTANTPCCCAADGAARGPAADKAAGGSVGESAASHRLFSPGHRQSGSVPRAV